MSCPLPPLGDSLFILPHLHPFVKGFPKLFSSFFRGSRPVRSRSLTAPLFYHFHFPLSTPFSHLFSIGAFCRRRRRPGGRPLCEFAYVNRRASHTIPKTKGNPTEARERQGLKRCAVRCLRRTLRSQPLRSDMKSSCQASFKNPRFPFRISR